MLTLTEPDFLQTTRAAYGTLADDYAGRFRDELAATPLERGTLAAFAVRERDEEGAFPEKTPQACLPARKPLAV